MATALFLYVKHPLMQQLKLTIELVPKSSWYTNVRSEVSKGEWDRIRRKCYAAAGHVCEICGDTGLNQGVKHPVECHEIWTYEDSDRIQRLTGLIALCPNCHKVKHPGLAQIKGELPIVINQLKQVNHMSFEQAVDYLQKSFALWTKRSKVPWSVDTSFLQTY